MQQRVKDTIEDICTKYNKNLSEKLKHLSYYVSARKTRRKMIFGYSTKSSYDEILCFYNELKANIIKILESEEDKLQIARLVSALDDLVGNPSEIEKILDGCQTPSMEELSSLYFNMKVSEKIGGWNKTEWIREFSDENKK